MISFIHLYFISFAEYHLFKHNIKPAWEDESNREGGKLTLRLKKGLASLYWEQLVFAMIGEQFEFGEDICGAVISMRANEDVLSIWNRSGDSSEVIGKIK